MNDKVDVIIIGAGIAGLSAGNYFSKRGIKFNILEARNRVGGRIHTIQDQDGYAIDLGAQFISRQQTRMISLAKQANTNLYRTYNRGKMIVNIDNKQILGNANFPPFPFLVMLDILQAMFRIALSSHLINVKEPWLSRNAVLIDNMSCAEWINKTLFTKLGKAYVNPIFEAETCKSNKDISMLSILHTIKTCGGLKNMIDSTEYFSEQGIQPIIDYLVKPIQDSIHLNEVVEHIHASDSGIIVKSNRQEWYGKFVIIAMPPVLQQKIEFVPRLSPAQTNLLKYETQGKVTKFILVYSSAFWRKSKLSGMILSDKGPAITCYDVSMNPEKRGVIVGFITGSFAEKYAGISKEERQLRITEQLKTYLGDEVCNLIGYYEKDWTACEFSQGGFGLAYSNRYLTQFNNHINKPHYNIYWAGSEFATVWRNFMEGALHSGEEQAQIICKKLLEGSS